MSNTEAEGTMSTWPWGWIGFAVALLIYVALVAWFRRRRSPDASPKFMPFPDGDEYSLISTAHSLSPAEIRKFQERWRRQIETASDGAIMLPPGWAYTPYRLSLHRVMLGADIGIAERGES
jgi:hypothetical protein